MYTPHRAAAFPAPCGRRDTASGKAAGASAGQAARSGCNNLPSVFFDGDDDTHLFASGAAKVVVPAGKIVIIGVDGSELGVVILTLVPQVDLRIIGHFKPFALGGKDAGRTHLVDLHGHQLHHVADRAGRLLADRDAAGQNRILDGSAQTDLLAADVADIGRTAADEVEYLADGSAGDLGDLLEAEAQKCAGVAGQALPCRAEDVAGDNAPQDLCGGGYHNALHLTDDCIGINGAVTRLRLDGAEKGAVVGGDILHIVQHTVVPQVAGHIVQNKRVDLPLRIGGVVADIGSL